MDDPMKHTTPMDIEREKRRAVPTLPDYTARNGYEVWYWDNKTWQCRGSRQNRDDALNLAESCGYPFFAVILCERRVELNTVED